MNPKRSRNISDTTRNQAQQLRRERTPAERLLWPHLRAHGLGGFKFRRQHPIDRFIVDFCCVESGVVVEIDGDVHAGREIEDAARSERLGALGYRVIRFTNDDIYKRIQAVLDEVLKACVNAKSMSPPPTPPKGRGARISPPLGGGAGDGAGSAYTHFKVKDLFDRAAQDYDTSRRQLIPCFDAFYGMALALLPDRPRLRILDVGAGTGLLSGLIRAQRLDAQITLADVSEAMLAKAQQRFAWDDNVAYEVIDFIEGELHGRFDGVVSALALHHTPQPQLKTVFAKIYRALEPGGIFINADQALGNTPENEAMYERMWRAAVLANGVEQTVFESAIERMKADRTATLDDQLTWLREVGFQQVECWFKEYRFVVYSGVK